MTRFLMLFPLVLLAIAVTPLYGSAEGSSRGSLAWFAPALDRHDDRRGVAQDADDATPAPSADPRIDAETTPAASSVDGTGRVTLEIVMPADAPAPGGEGCDPSYPQLCIPRDADDLDCHEMGVAGFTVLAPDRHALDDDADGLGCEG